MGAFSALLKRDLALAIRLGGGGATALAFFTLAVLMIPFGVGAELPVLARIAGGVLWVAALLACLLSLDRVFQADFEDGSLDQLLTSGLPAELTVAAKAIAHWLTTGLPIVVAAPILGLMLAIPEAAIQPLILSLLAGTPALSFIGAVGAALTVGVRRGGLLLSILVLPLYVPTLIFGARVVEAATSGEPTRTAFLFLAAVTLFTFAICPVAAAWALRVNAR